jgi:hypothetical protein
MKQGNASKLTTTLMNDQPPQVLQYPANKINSDDYFAEDTHKYMYCSDGVFSEFIYSIITKTINVDFKQYTHALEMGAGMGRFSFALPENFQHVYLIEPSESYVSVIKKLFQQENVTVIHMTMEKFFRETAIPPQSVFFNFHLLHHLTFEQRKEYFTYLHKAHASAVFMEPNPWNPLIILQLLLYPDMRMKDEWQYLKLTKKTLSQELNACGLTVSAYGKLCFLPPPITKIALKSPLIKKPLFALEGLKHVLPFLSSYHVLYCTNRP